VIVNFVKGQRWVSSMEPELGLGIVDEVEHGRVSLQFPAHEESRTYTSRNAPLKRVRFAKGEAITDREGVRIQIVDVTEKEYLFLYHGDNDSFINESDLADNLSFSKPHDRLLAGHADPMEVFDLRHEALRFQHAMRSSRLRGFQGARIELIPHQLYVAQEVASRYAPRVLLADEVGLGKTIQAALILHNLLLSERVQRVLILVPESLMHQWFVELLRRFQITFSLFDEARCESIEQEQQHQESDVELNPFLEEQLVICDTNFLADNPKRGEQALEAGWDLLIVDEAHHLEWNKDEVSPAYALVEKLAEIVRRLILLTATPEQLGREGHFARLRLLDPERYTTLEKFDAQSAAYEEIAHLADGLLGKVAMSNADWQRLKSLFSHYTPDESAELIEGAAMEDRSCRARLLEDLLDQYGTGRVMFRNRRASMDGFPARKVELVPLKATKGNAHVEWLAGWLRALNPNEKVLLICSTTERVLQIEEDLRGQINVKMGVFHDGMNLLQRDRSAAYFSEDDGAQILLCSEIGSEGRNFQFAHRLILLDLPQDPALLEQRIGRLDRIGQTETIQIFVPYLVKSGEEMIARWYHEGLDAFETCQQSGHRYFREFGAALEQLMKRVDASGRYERKRFEKLLSETTAFHEATVKELDNGRDHLLELNSFRDEPALKLVEEIQQADEDPDLEMFFLKLLDHFGVTVEELHPRVYHLKPEHVYTDAFPGLTEEGVTMTLDRSIALKREEIQFLTWDHPMVRGAMDLLIGSENGNCAFAYMDATGPKMLFLEAVYLLECVAPTELHADRFFPSTPIRVLVSHRNENYTDTMSIEQMDEYVRPGKPQWVQKNVQTLQDLLPKLQAFSGKVANELVPDIISANRVTMRTKLQTEVDRLRHLRSINDHIREEEVSLAETCLKHLEKAMAEARLRLDSMRLLFKGDD
jgi:ATP-dependent helicase HepA